MNAALLLAALAAAPLLALGRAWLGPWAPDPTCAVLAWAHFAPGRAPRAAVVLLLGVGRALLLLEPVGGQLLAAWLAAGVLGASREGLRELAGPRPLLPATLLAALAWIAAARLTGLALAPAPAAGGELLLGALWVLPVSVRAVLRARRRRLA